MEEILNKLKFEKIKVDNGETIEIHRIYNKGGCIEFVRLKDSYYKPHIHKNSNTKLFIMQGKGLVIINNKKMNYKEGSIIEVPKVTSHGFEVKKETIMLSIQDYPILNKNTGKIDIEYDE